MALTVAAKIAAEVMKFLMFGGVGVVIVLLSGKSLAMRLSGTTKLPFIYNLKSLIPTTWSHLSDSRPVGPWPLRV